MCICYVLKNVGFKYKVVLTNKRLLYNVREQMNICFLYP